MNSSTRKTKIHNRGIKTIISKIDTIHLTLFKLNVSAMFSEFINLSPSLSSKSFIISLDNVKKKEKKTNIIVASNVPSVEPLSATTT